MKKFPKLVSKRIVFALEEFADDPRAKNTIKIRGTNYFRMRVGDYRVIYEIHNQKLVILVIDVGHRKNIYK